MTIISTSQNGGGAAVNFTHSGGVKLNPQVGMTYGEWLQLSGCVKPISNTERTRRQLAKEARQARVQARLDAAEAARQDRKKAHQSRMGIKHSKGA